MTREQIESLRELIQKYLHTYNLANFLQFVHTTCEYERALWGMYSSYFHNKHNEYENKNVGDKNETNT